MEDRQQVELTEGATVNCSLDAMMAAAGFVARTWGDYGYTIERVAHGLQGWGSVRLGVCASDGSRFTVGADRYGNCEEILEPRASRA